MMGSCADHDHPKGDSLPSKVAFGSQSELMLSYDILPFYLDNYLSTNIRMREKGLV